MAVEQRLVAPRMVYIHKETTNQSFIDMHHFLKSKGIQNNDFFLTLLDPSLAGVNPRDPNLSTQMKYKVMRECCSNYWYFLREVVMIPEQGGAVGGGSRYILNRGNLAMNFLFVLNFSMFLVLPRQWGKTVGALCRYLWCYNFGTSYSEIMFMHKDHTGSKNNLKSLKNIRDNLPTYLQMSSNIGSDGKKLKVPNTIVMMEHPSNHNKIVTFPSARSKDLADNLGRGSTMPMQYYDEFAFMPYNKTVYLAATPAFSRASMNAAKNNAPFGMLLTTTPGDLTTDSGLYAYEVYNNATEWNESFYDKSVQELTEIVNSNPNNQFVQITYSYKQLGGGQEYLNKMIREMGRSWPEIRREILLEWSETSDNCPFTKEKLDIIATMVKDPIRTLEFGRFGQYQIKIYENMDTDYPAIVGVDVSGANWRDASAITIIDSKNTKVIATFNCNFIPADDLADMLYVLATKYIQSCVINIERNGENHTAVHMVTCVFPWVKTATHWSMPYLATA